MRRSTTIRLTLLPLLASAAMAHAQAPGETAPAPPSPPAPPANGPGAAPAPDAQLDAPAPPPPPPMDTPSNAPGMTPPLSEECQEDPDLEDCPTAVWSETTYTGGVIYRGGFGGYFWTGGG